MCHGYCAFVLLQKWAMGEGSVRLVEQECLGASAEPLAELALSLSQEYFVNEVIRGG